MPTCGLCRSWRGGAVHRG